MSAQTVLSTRRRILRNLLWSFLGLSVLSFAALGWWVTTDSFQQGVRRRVIASLEETTGGRVELGELHTIPFRLRLDVRHLTIHGREGPDQAPFVQVERVQAELKIISLFGKEIGLHWLSLEHPGVHIVDYADGSTNIPSPTVKYSSQENAVQRLIALSVSRIEAHRGELLWQDHKVPFEFDATQLWLLLDYSLLHRWYEAEISAGNVATEWQRYRRFNWSTNVSLVLDKDRVDIKHLAAKSGASEFHFAGQVKDFRDPHISGDYDGVADLGELALDPQLSHGKVQFSGKGVWSLQDFRAAGTVDAKDLEWLHGKEAWLRNGRVAAEYAMDPLRLRISSVKANLLGGNLVGDVDITNWQSPAEPVAARQRKTRGGISLANAQRGSAHIQLGTFPLAPLADLISSKKLPLDRLRLAANANGAIQLLWVGSVSEAESRIQLDISPRTTSGANEIPLSGRIDGIYRGSRSEAELKILQLTTNGSEIQASGNLAPGSALRFTFATHNSREWMPFLEAAYGTPQLPFAIQGWASVSGSASGTISSCVVTGNLEVYDFETTLPATSRTPAPPVHWDALTTRFQYSGDNFAAHNGSVVHGHTVVRFDASAGLAAGSLEEDSPFTLRVDVLNGDVAEMARLAGIDRPLAGKARFAFNLSGTRRHPHGDGHFEVRDGIAYGEAIPSIEGDLRLANNEFEFNQVSAKAYGASISGNGSINVSAGEFRANIAGRDLSLSRFPCLQSARFALDGMAEFAAHISGTTQQPALEGQVRLRNLAVDKKPLGEFYIDVTTTGHELVVKAHSSFERSSLAINGSVELQKEFGADFRVDFRDLDVAALLGIYLPGRITAVSPMDGSIQVRGPLRTPRELKVAANLASFHTEVERIGLNSVGAVRFEVVDQTLLLESLHLAGGGTDFTAHGEAHLAGTQELNMGVDGSIDMTLLQLLDPKIQARGTVGVGLNAAGTLRQPVLEGRLDVKNTFVSHADFPSGLSDLNGNLTFDRNRIQIQSMKGTTGGGTIALSGTSTYENGVWLLDVGATARTVRLRYPPGVSSAANADLRLTGSTNAATLSGSVIITRLAVTPGFDFGAYVARSRQEATITQTNSLASHVRLDVHITTTPELQMQTATARLSGDADLRLRGTADRPVILGRAEVLEGEISFNGNKYRLERGDVTFANPAKTQPVVDVQAATRVRDYDITVRFRGDASAPNGLKVSWQSEPQLPAADVIALLALGRTQEEAAQGQSSGSFGMGGEASNLLINEALNSGVSSRVQRLFGVSRVKIDPQGLVTETSVARPGPQLTVEQQVVSNLTLTYSTNVSVSNQQIIQAEYNLSHNMSIVALRDQNGVVSFDLKIRKRRK